ncbi:MAG: aminomethyl-transferring glycine dehydrogenase subunit GcvPB [Halanaerobiaceae bacterium]
MKEPVIKDYSSEGRTGYSLPDLDIPDKNLNQIIDQDYIRSEEPELPEVSEVDVVRHYTNLSSYNYGVDSGIYPLGSCTMKYNPKINEDIAEIEDLTRFHPYQNEKDVQGILKIMYELKKDLAAISGMDSISLQPASGAQGEFTGLLIIRKYLQEIDSERNKIIVPDSAHGTNPASATMAGFEVVEVSSDEKGMIDIDELKKEADDDLAGLMITNPNTLGIFEKNILKISDIVHEAGGLVYYDGANMNAIMGYVKPGNMNLDIIHFNLHKTFSTPHGGGGPGSGPIGVKQYLEPYLPEPLLKKEKDKYYWDRDRPKSIGKVHSFYGNYQVMLKAYSYIKILGGRGLKETTENAVLNANYLKSELKNIFELPYQENSLHEFVLSAKKEKKEGISTLNIAKRLLDYNQYAPTIYFPLIVKEALMIEPTETENLKTLNKFVDTLKNISREIQKNPEIVQNAPHSTPVKKLDEAEAARNLNLKW